MSDTSSSEDEHLNQIKEALDAELIHDSMFNSSTKVEKPTETKSLRRNLIEEDEHHNLFKTTPEFRKYVSKHLERILEGQLQQKLRENTILYEKRRVKLRKSGVKLLSTSSVFLSLKTDEKSVIEHNKINKRRLFRVEDPTEEIKRIKCVVVDPQTILSKVEVKSWQQTNKEKYKVENYKIIKGSLVLLDG